MCMLTMNGLKVNFTFETVSKYVQVIVYRHEIRKREYANVGMKFISVRTSCSCVITCYIISEEGISK